MPFNSEPITGTTDCDEKDGGNCVQENECISNVGIEIENTLNSVAEALVHEYQTISVALDKTNDRDIRSDPNTKNDTNSGKIPLGTLYVCKHPTG
jgi:hypothetical protein